MNTWGQLHKQASALGESLNLVGSSYAQFSTDDLMIQCMGAAGRVRACYHHRNSSRFDARPREAVYTALCELRRLRQALAYRILGGHVRPLGWGTHGSPRRLIMGEIADEHEDEFLAGDYVRTPRFCARPRRQLQQFTIGFSRESGAGSEGPTWRMSGTAEVMAYTSAEAMGQLRNSNPMFRHAFLEVLRP